MFCASLLSVFLWLFSLKINLNFIASQLNLLLSEVSKQNQNYINIHTCKII